MATKPKLKSSAFKTKLAKIKKSWGKAYAKSAELGGFSELPDGRYLANLIGYDINESKNDRLQLVTEWRVAEGENQGESTKRFDGLVEDSLPYLIKYMISLGVDESEAEAFGEAEDIGEAVELKIMELVEAQVGARISLKTNGDFQNLRVDKLMDVEVAEAKDKDDGKESGGEEAVEGDGEATLEVGSKVSWGDDNERTGEVVKIVSDTEIHVKKDDGGKVIKISPADLTMVADEEAVEEDVPAKSKGKATVVAKSAKPKKADMVTFKHEGTKFKGRVVTVNSASQEVDVMVKDKLYKGLGFDDVAVLAA